MCGEVNPYTVKDEYDELHTYYYFCRSFKFEPFAPLHLKRRTLLPRRVLSAVDRTSPSDAVGARHALNQRSRAAPLLRARTQALGKADDGQPDVQNWPVLGMRCNLSLA